MIDKGETTEYQAARGVNADGTAEPAIVIEDLHFKYAGRKAEALQGVNLRINRNEAVLLLGPSGSGKSTLALAMNGLIPHAIEGRFEGSVQVAGMDTRTTPLAELTQQAGIVFQDPEAQFVAITVDNEVAFGLENLRVPHEQMPERIRVSLAEVGLENRMHERVDRLSGGGKQRLALASILALQPHILLFDEPTANLDPAGTRELFATIEALQHERKFTIVLIEHKLDALMQMIDRVVVLQPGGQALCDGDPRSIFRDHAQELLDQGVWMPQVSLLAYRLYERGIVLDPFPLTVDDAIQALTQKSAVAQAHAESVTADRGSGSTGAMVIPAEQAGKMAQHESAPFNPPAIEVRNLSFSYGKRIVLDRINLTVPPGDFLAIAGANGAGKTTLVQHMIDIIHPPRKTVFIDGTDITRIPTRELIKRAGYVFQNPEYQFVTDTVEHELSFSLQLMKLPEQEIERRVTAMLEQFGLARYARANPYTLSHGEKRRLSVATMLIAGQQILILDEPTFGQDERNATALLELLRRLHREGRTIIVITHDMSLVAEYARSVAVLAEGNLLYHGTPAELFRRPDLLRQAALALPPMAELARKLNEAEPDSGWGDFMTLEEAVAACAQKLLPCAKRQG